MIRRCLMLVGLCSIISGCFGADHPNTARYEYLSIDGVFQGSHRSYPEGLDRSNWTCVDRKAQRAFSCSMVRGGWDQFQYIYRER